MFRLDIKTENAAFYPNVRMELCAILRSVIKQLDEGTANVDHEFVRDENGNRVGAWILEHDDE
jgi:hypothetical protein